MKIANIITIIATVLFAALAVASLLLDVMVRDLRIGVGSQEAQVLTAERRNADLAQALQNLEERKERQEEANDSLRQEMMQKQIAIQSQQEQISQGTAIAQQIAPNLLRDMAESSLKNERMRQLLIKHGYTVQSK